MSNKKFIDLKDYKRYPPEEMIERSQRFYNEIKTRRTVRDYSEESFPVEVIENCIMAAGTAPNGANLQPWHFVVVSDKEIKKKIRIAAEEEERGFYGGKAPQEWLDALSHLGTDANKPFLETAPYLIVIFEKKYNETSEGKKKNYYTKESVGIASGMLITALHQAGIAALTHTPSPMNFLSKILKRPPNEKPYLILVTGFPAEDVKVPDISKKNLKEITTFL